jgi:hypothetical protein
MVQTRIHAPVRGATAGIQIQQRAVGVSIMRRTSGATLSGGRWEILGKAVTFRLVHLKLTFWIQMHAFRNRSRAVSDIERGRHPGAAPTGRSRLPPDLRGRPANSRASQGRRLSPADPACRSPAIQGQARATGPRLHPLAGDPPSTQTQAGWLPVRHHPDCRGWYRPATVHERDAPATSRFVAWLSQRRESIPPAFAPHRHRNDYRAVHLFRRPICRLRSNGVSP